MIPAIIPRDRGEEGLEWLAVAAAIADGHERPRALVADSLLHHADDALLNRSAWVEGLGIAVKVATVFPGNVASGGETLGGAVVLCSDKDGQLEAVLDFHLVTKWKTAGDSLLAATRLARKDSRKILLVGAGAQARNLHDAYAAAFPEAHFTVWNRSPEGARRFVADRPGTAIADDLQAAVAGADIISCSTMARAPLVLGEWLRPGQHLDLVGAYGPGMREVDDAALVRSRLFVDSRDTTVNHIGEIMDPIASGAITADHIVADYYQPASFRRQTDDEITVFKNGGGAHLDLMVSRHILEVWRARHG